MKIKRLFVLSILSAFLMTNTAFANSEMPIDIAGIKTDSIININGYHLLTSGGVDVALGSSGLGIPLIAPENAAAIANITGKGPAGHYSKQNWSYGNFNRQKARTLSEILEGDAGTTAEGGEILVYGMPFDLDTEADPGSVFWKLPGGELGRTPPSSLIPPNPVHSKIGLLSGKNEHAEEFDAIIKS